MHFVLVSSFRVYLYFKNFFTGTIEIISTTVYKRNTRLWPTYSSLAAQNNSLLTSGGFILNASAILTYSSLTLVNPSILPVGLPCASCVWNTSLGRRLAGGGGSPALADLLPVPAPACPPLNSSLSTKCSFVGLVFFLHGPSGIFVSLLEFNVND